MATWAAIEIVTGDSWVATWAAIEIDSYRRLSGGHMGRNRDR